MDWATIEANLLAVFVVVTGLQAQWRKRPGQYAGPAYGLLYISSPTGQGEDALEFEHDNTQPQGGELEPHQRGNREFVWEVQIVSHSASVQENALYYGELLRGSLRLPAVEALMRDAEIGVQSVPMLREIDAKYWKRAMRIAQLDVKFNAESDLPGTRFGYVETYDMEGSTYDQTGTQSIVIDGEVPA